MRHTDDEIERPARRFEQWPTSSTQQPPRSTTPTTSEQSQPSPRRYAQTRHGCVRPSRYDRSWNQNAVALGVSRQAARQRFTDKTHA